MEVDSIHVESRFDSTQSKSISSEFLVSKETVVLRRLERSKQFKREKEIKNLVLSNELIKVELPP